MPSNRVTYTVGINADVSEARTAINQVIQDLQRLGTNPQLVPEMRQAAEAAYQLGKNLESAINPQTGNLDLSKFNENLRSSGQTLNSYYEQLRLLGGQGQETFLQLASAISKTEAPLMRTSRLMSDLWTTMRNTVRWQITASALQGFTGALSDAYRYTQDLNESLTNIRIVTGNSAEQMRDFAQYANQAAQNLSTTTTEYADAALIYYQQGLPEDQVQARTETTIRLAQAAGISAQEASEELTAIWNNFYEEGGPALEYYADVLVRLGADTASSSEEISEGLQQFASVADSVGLSYEYAAAALATITATTRESANTVGTALRTLFARFQSLSLGETLEDGVDLNKYSKALQAVGVQVLDVNGELRDMDDVLSDLAGVWDTLSSAQQVALAQTVGGVRQYTRLVAILDNWDFFEQNLASAYGAEGSLQEQADIYAESWEAARDRVTAAAENIYDSFINDQLFIDLDDALTPFLNGIASLIDTLGGLPGILNAAWVIANRLFGDQMAQSVRNMAYNLGVLTGTEANKVIGLQRQAAELSRQIMYSVSGETENSLLYQRADAQARILDLQTQINTNTQNLTGYQRELLQQDLDRIRNQQQLAQAFAKQGEEQQRQINNYRDSLYNIIPQQSGYGWRNNLSEMLYDSQGNEVERYKSISADIQSILNSDEIDSNVDALIRLTDAYEDAIVQQSAYEKAQKLIVSNSGKVDQAILNQVKNMQGLSNIVQNMNDKELADFLDINNLQTNSNQATERINALGQAIINLGAPANKVNNTLNKFAQAIRLAGNDADAERMAYQALREELNNLANTMNNPPKRDWADYLVQVSGLISSVVMAVQGLQNLGEVFDNTDLSAGERLIQIFTSLGMIIPAVSNSLKLLTQNLQVSTVVEGNLTKVVATGTGSKLANAVASRIMATATNAETTATTASMAALAAKTAVMLAYIAVIAAVGVAIYALVKAYNADADAAREAAETANNLADEYDRAKNAYEELNSTITDYKDAKDALSELTTEAEGYADALEEANQKAQDLMEQYPELRAQAYRDTSGLIQFEDLDSVQQEIASQVSNAETASTLAQMRANEADATNQITQFSRHNNIRGEVYTDSYTSSVESLTRSQIEAIVSAIIENGGTLVESDLDNIEELSNVSETLRRSILDNSEDLIELANSVNTLNESTEFLASEMARSFLQGNNQDYGNLTSAQQAAIDSMAGTIDVRETQAYEDALDTYEDMTDAEIQAEYARRQGYDYAENGNFFSNAGTGNYVNADTGEEIRLQDSFVRDWLAWDDAQRELYGDDSEAYQQMRDTATRISEVVNEVVDGFDTEILGFVNQLDTAFDSSKWSPEQIEAISNSLDDMVNGFSETDFHLMGYESGTQFAEAVQEAIDNYDAEAYYDAIQQRAATAESNARDLMTSIQTGETDYQNIGENEDYTNLISELSQLKDIYPELNAEWIILSENWEVGTQRFLEALQNVQYALAQIELEGLAEDANDAITTAEDIINSEDFDIEVDADLQEFNDAISDVLDAEYAINIEVHTQAESEFNSLVNALDDIEEKASMIGEGFVVSADDIRELNNTFPGIIQGIEEVGDGTIRLNEDVVQSAIESARQEVAADAQSAVERLTIQANLLRAKQQTYLTMAEAASVLASSETASEEEQAQARATISQGLEDLKQQNSEIATNTINTHAEEAADAADINAGITAGNWASAFQSAADSSAQFARIAIQNMQAVTAMDMGAVTSGAINSNYAGASGQSVEASQIEETSNMLEAPDTSDQDWAEQAAYFEAMAEAAGAAANDIEGMIAQIGGMVSGVGAGFSGVESGQGWNGGSGGGGGSDEAKQYDLEEEKNLEDIEDRYHEINREIERQSDLLDDIDNATDRAYGNRKLAGFDQQIQELNGQLDNYNQKLAEAESYLSSDKANLSNLFNGQISFDANGEIQNYRALEQEMVNEYNTFLANYNAFIQAFNALTKAEQEARQGEYESWQQQLQAAQDLFESRQNAIKQYEDTLDTIQEIRDNIEETQRAIADARLEKIEYRLEVVLDVHDAEDAVRELTREISESFGDLLTHGIEATQIGWDTAQADMGLLSEYQQTYNEYLGELANADEYVDVDRIIDDLQDLQDKAVGTAEELLAWIEELETVIPDAIDDARERFDQFLDQLDHNDTIAEAIGELYELQGVTIETQEGYNRLQSVTQERLDNAVAQAQLNRQWYEEAQQRLAEAEAALVGVSETDAEYDYLRNKRDALLEEYNEASEAMLDSATAAMEAAQEMYTRALEKALNDFDKILTDGVGLDNLQTRYDHFIDTEERYLDKVNEAYEVASWYNKLQTDIDNTTDAAMRERLKSLQEEIDIRRENNTLSEYDLDILEAKYQVLQAQMALEEAQNNRNQLRLVRDSQGNWNYQYTADADQIADAQNNLLEAENNWYNLAKDQVTDVTGEIISTWQECHDAINDIYSDMTLSDEERSQRAQEIYDYYVQKIKDLENEKQVAINDMNEAGNQQLIDATAATGADISDLVGMTAEDLKNIVSQAGMDINDLLLADQQQLIDIFGQNSEVVNAFDNTYADALSNMTNNTVNFEQYLSDLLAQAENNFNNYRDTVANVADDTGTSLDQLDSYLEQTSDSTDRLADAGMNATDAMWQQIDAIMSLCDQYAQMLDIVYQNINAQRELAAAIAATIAAEANKEASSTGENSSLGSSGLGYDPNTDYNDLISDGIRQGWLTYGSSTYEQLNAQRNNKIQGEGLYEDKYINGMPAEQYFASVNKGETPYQWNNQSSWKDKLSSLGISGYASGGYTGEFSNGRLAILHEKELVLNQEDTKNILAAVEVVRSFTPELLRSIESTLDNNVIALIGTLADKISSNAQVASTHDTLEQIVTIEHVEFPNVTSANEINQALESLVNDAAQWASRRKS